MYDEGYFQGANSGYPAQGYSEGRPDWTPWLDFLVTILPPPATWLDLGCAFGYLPAAARARGYRAFGADISGFAVRQEPAFTPFLVQSQLPDLPFCSESADLVSLFDVLEHLLEVEQVLARIVRLLKPGGVLVGATPDPIFFDRFEETHFSERPPSFWLSRLEELGLEVAYRFSGPAYNFQFLAAFPGSLPAGRLKRFRHDYFEDRDDFLQVRGSLSAMPRSGWSELNGAARRMTGNHASIYVRNRESRPQRVRLSLQITHSSDFSTLRIRQDSLVLTELALGSENRSHSVTVEDLLLPSGGHHLFFDLIPGGPDVTVSEITIESSLTDAEELCEQLPFDLYQRYRLCADLAAILKPTGILDVGGLLGDRDGHLATPGDFFGLADGGPPTIVSTDLRHCDHPQHVPADGGDLPFADSSFDLVVSMDVLEHLPAETRDGYFAELYRLTRNWIILGAPINAPETLEMERTLRETLQLPFLLEHAAMGLPSDQQIRRYFEGERGCHLLALPNGFLPRWKELQLWTQFFFSLHRIEISRLFNQICNQTCYPFDQAFPSYRTLYLISKEPLPPETEAEVKGLLSQAPHPATASCQERMAADPRFARLLQDLFRLQQTQDKTLGDLQFLLNQRQEHIRLLFNEITQLRSTPLLDIAKERFRRRLGK